MRHRKKRSKLGMMTSHRKATLRNIAKALLKYQRIKISLARAKEVRRLVEHLVTLTKEDTVISRRRAFDILTDRDLVGKLFKETAPLFKNRTSGYTRIIPLGFRRGDGAQLCFLELTEKTMIVKVPKKKKGKEEKPAAKGQEAKHAAADEKEKPKATDEVKRAKEEHKKEAKKLETEKMTERAKSEDKKLADKKGFMKNLRGLFRKRGDF